MFLCGNVCNILLIYCITDDDKFIIYISVSIDRGKKRFLRERESCLRSGGEEIIFRPTMVKD